jgi:hypothetical protein
MDNGKKREIFEEKCESYIVQFSPFIERRLYRWRGAASLVRGNAIGPIHGIASVALNRIGMAVMEIHEDFMHPAELSEDAAERRRLNRRTPVLGPAEFAITLGQNVAETVRKCAMCGHKEHEDSEYSEEGAEKEKDGKESANSQHHHHWSEIDYD